MPQFELYIEGLIVENHVTPFEQRILSQVKDFNTFLKIEIIQLIL